MHAHQPVEGFPPGEYIKDELDARGWTQTDLAHIMGRTTAVVNELISGTRGITRQTALELGEAFGSGTDFWMNLEATYRHTRPLPPEDSSDTRCTICSAKASTVSGIRFDKVPHRA